MKVPPSQAKTAPKRPIKPPPPRKCNLLKGQGAVKVYVPPPHNSFDRERTRLSREQFIRETVLTSPGINKLTEEERRFLSTDTKRIPTDLSQMFMVGICDDNLSPEIDGKIISIGSRFVDPSLPKEEQKSKIQKAVADAIVANIFKIYGKEPDSPKTKETISRYVFCLNSLGFSDSRIDLLYLLLSAPLNEPDRRFAESLLVFRDAPVENKQKALTQKLTGKLTAALKELSLKRPKETKAALQDFFLFCQMAKTAGLKDSLVASIYKSIIGKAFPVLVQKFSGKNREEIIKYLLDRPVIPEEETLRNAEGYFEQCYLLALAGITQAELGKSWANKASSWFEYEASKALLYLEEALSEGLPIKIIIAKNRALSVFDGFAEALQSPDRKDQKEIQLAMQQILVHLQMSRQISLEEKHIYTMKTAWPNLTAEDLRLSLNYQLSGGQDKPRAKSDLFAHFAALISRTSDSRRIRSFALLMNHANVATKREILTFYQIIALPLGTKSALQWPLDQQTETLEAQLFRDLHQLDQKKIEYLQLLKNAQLSYDKGFREAAHGFFERARKISEGALPIETRLDSKYKKIAKLRQREAPLAYPHIPELTYKISMPGTRIRFKAGFGLIKNMLWDLSSIDTMSGFTEKAKKKWKERVIVSEAMGIYMDTFSAPLSWDVHGRLRNAPLILTQPRIQLIKRHAHQYKVDPNLVAAMILAEQRDQSVEEDITDRWGGRLGQNTSVGLGQLTITTVRRLFPELKDSLGGTIVSKLLEDDFNIQATAKFLRNITRKATVYFGRKPKIREIGSRFTSSVYNYSDWGMFTELCYNDVKMAGFFDNNNLEGIKPTLELYEELRTFKDMR